ncbi:MAG: pectate lyase [Pseudomonadota bacterium]
MKTLILTIILAFGFAPALSAAMPVIPGANGFGMTTPAGRGGDVIRVTNLNRSGSGSLKACIDAVGPRVCVFEVSGTIQTNALTWIRNPYITIAGQTAPEPGITIVGAGLRVAASDVLIQHISIRPGDAPDGPSPSVRDAIIIGGNAELGVASNIVIDHCSFSWSIDELFSASAFFWDNLTIRHTLLSDPLDDSFHSKTGTPGNGDGHGLGMILAGDGARADVRNSVFTNARARSPLIRSTNSVAVNNVIYNWRRVATEISRGDTPSFTDIIENLYIEGPDMENSAAIAIGRTNEPLDSGSRAYVSGNTRIRQNGSMSSVGASNRSSSVNIASSPLHGAVSSATMDSADSDFLTVILSNVGSRPAMRSPGSVDARIIQGIVNQTGTSVNCVEADGSTRCDRNAGGWPDDTSVERPLTLPNNPTGDDDGDGYTNLEEWLHTLAAELEVSDMQSMKRPGNPGSFGVE